MRSAISTGDVAVRSSAQADWGGRGLFRCVGEGAEVGVAEHDVRMSRG